ILTDRSCCFAKAPHDEDRVAPPLILRRPAQAGPRRMNASGRRPFGPHPRTLGEKFQRIEIAANERVFFRAAPPLYAPLESDGIVKPREPFRPDKRHGPAFRRVGVRESPGLMLRN